VREGGISFLIKSKYWEKSEILGKKILTLTQGGLGNNKPDPPCVKKIPVKKFFFFFGLALAHARALLFTNC